MKQMAIIGKLSHIITLIAQERRDYLLAQGVVLILAIFFVYSVYSQIAGILRLASTSKQQLSAMIAYTSTNQFTQTMPSDAEINNWYLFGGSASNSSIASNYSLFGIVFSNNNSAEKKAIISVNNGESAVYGIGDKLPQGAIIKSIDTDKVIIINNGKEQKLTLRWDPIIGNTGDW